jgi:hypothetical protein
MRTEHLATIVARGIGLGLIILGASDALYAFPFAGMASSGWTSYSPLGGTSSANTSFFTADSAGASVLLPCLAQLAIGSAMILLGKPIGRWLARGLKDDSGD